MLGRAAYQSPGSCSMGGPGFLRDESRRVGYDKIIAAMMDYCEPHIAHGGRLHQVTRHMVGLFQGVPGARRWRQILSSDATAFEAGPEVIERAYGEIAVASIAAQ